MRLVWFAPAITLWAISIFRFIRTGVEIHRLQIEYQKALRDYYIAWLKSDL